MVIACNPYVDVILCTRKVGVTDPSTRPQVVLRPLVWEPLPQYSSHTACRYKEAVTRLSKLFRSKPIHPKEAAVFAIEHVLEHGGEHLRPSSVHLPLYQLLLLDVILAVLAPVVALLLCCRVLCCRRGAKAAKAAKDGASKAKKSN